MQVGNLRYSGQGSLRYALRRRSPAIGPPNALLLTPTDVWGAGANR